MIRVQSPVIVAFVLLSMMITGCSSHVSNEKVRIAIEWRDQGDTAQYKDTVLEALRDDPLDVYAVNAMGAIYEAEGNYREAEAFYQEVYQRAGILKVEYSGTDAGKLLRDEAGESLRDVRKKMMMKDMTDPAPSGEVRR